MVKFKKEDESREKMRAYRNFNARPPHLTLTWTELGISICTLQKLMDVIALLIFGHKLMEFDNKNG